MRREQEVEALPRSAAWSLDYRATHPYRKSGSTEFVLEHEGKRVIGYTFNGEFYLRKSEQRIVPKSGGFKGYISMQVPRPPAGFEKTVQTTTFGEGARNSFGLKWPRARGKETLPQYYRHTRKQGLAVTPSKAPAKLAALEFRSASNRSSYTSADGSKPPEPHLQARLSDGSVVTYAWFRFIDQPSIRALGWSAADLDRLQKRSRSCTRGGTEACYRHQAEATLVALDTALLARPPRDKQKGYVPIAIRQSEPAR